MPIIEKKAPSAAPPPTPTVNLYSSDYQTSVVDTNENPISSLIVFVEGTPWATDAYYSQLVGNNDELKPLDLNLSATHQQYTKVSGLVMKVTAGLSGPQDQTTKQFSLVGASTMFPFVVPNVGDMFTADCGNGRLGLFTVTLAETKTILKETCYSVEYGMVAILDAAYANDLARKTVKTVFYNGDRTSTQQNPLLEESEVLTLKTAKQIEKQLLAEYISEFFNLEVMNFAVPEQGTLVYDHFITTLITSLYSTDCHPVFRKMKGINIDGTFLSEKITLVNALLTFEQGYLPQSFRKIKLAETTIFDHRACMEGIRYSGYDYIAFPDTDDLKYVGKVFKVPELLDSMARVSIPANQPHFTPVVDGGHYLLSEEFHQGTHNGTTLEITLRKVFDNEPIEYQNVKLIINEIKQGGQIDRYYYLPIVLILLKYIIAKV